MAGVDLTAGAIELLSRGYSSHMFDVKPVLQVTDIRQIVDSRAQAAGGDKVWYQFLLSDGSLLQHGMLASQRNDLVRLVRSKRFQKGSVVRLTQFVIRIIDGRTVISIMDLDVIMFTCHLIGDPQPNLLNPAGRNDRSSTAVQPASMQQLSTPGAAKLQSFGGGPLSKEVEADRSQVRLQAVADNEAIVAKLNNIGELKANQDVIKASLFVLILICLVTLMASMIIVFKM